MSCKETHRLQKRLHEGVITMRMGKVKCSLIMRFSLYLTVFDCFYGCNGTIGLEITTDHDFDCITS